MSTEPKESITRKLCALVAKCRQSLVLPDEAVALRMLMAREKAEACWNRILTLKQPERFSSVDVGIYGHLTRRNLARIAEEKGDLRTARRLWEEVLVGCPDDMEAVEAIS